MRKASLKRLIWLVNVFLVLAVGGAAYWALQSQAAEISFTEDGQPDAADTVSPTSPVPQPKKLTFEQLEVVFSRRFAPAGPKDARSGSEDRPDLMGQLTAVSPVAPPVPASDSPAPSVAPDFAPEPAAKPSGPPLDSLIRLVAIFHDPDPKMSGVVIEKKKTRAQELYWLGDALEGIEAKVSGVEESQVGFLYHGSRVSLELTEGKAPGGAAKPPARPASPSSTMRERPRERVAVDPQYRHVVPKSEIAAVVQQPITALRGIRYTLMEDKNTRKVQGFRLAGIQEGTLAARYGLKNGDVIGEVNGRPVDANFSPFTMITEVLSSDVVQVKVKRNNRDIVLSYELQK